jgi:ATP-dependent DNA ligase
MAPAFSPTNRARIPTYKNGTSVRLLSRRSDHIIATPPIYMAFDVLFRAGQDLSQSPLRERRPLLEEIVAGHDLVLRPVVWLAKRP